VNLTKAQVALLDKLFDRNDPHGTTFIRGSEVEIARRLERAGLVVLDDMGEIKTNGSHVDGERWLCGLTNAGLHELAQWLIATERANWCANCDRSKDDCDCNVKDHFGATAGEVATVRYEPVAYDDESLTKHAEEIVDRLALSVEQIRHLVPELRNAISPASMSLSLLKRESAGGLSPEARRDHDDNLSDITGSVNRLKALATAMARRVNEDA
jgi:hypothetical protein